jgi:anti-sigma factor RsiW
MTCREVLDLVESVAAGDAPADAAFREHVETCVTCAAALASARAIEAALAARSAPAAPVRFEAAVAARIRHEQWRAEEQVDRAFNVAVGIGVLAIVGGALALFNLASVTAAIASAAGALAAAASQPVASSAQQGPPLWYYGLGCALLGTSVLVWRWAEGPRERSALNSEP